MTKRTLFIIIGLLALLDVAAIIIYLSAPNREGKSPLDTTFDRNDTHTQADILPDKTTIDDFESYQDTVNFLSTDKVEDGGELKRMSATVMINLYWPKEINNSNQFLELQNALMLKLTGKTYPNAKTMFQDLISNPKFVKPSTHFTRVDRDFSASRGASHTTRRYTVMPHFGTHFRLEMMVVIDTFDGSSDSRSFYIVHYDRQKGKIITNDEIFDNSSTRDVVALINQKIESMKIDGGLESMNEITSIPKEFVLGEKSAIFYVEQGQKYYEVKVNYSALEPYFTSYFAEQFKNDTKLVSYQNILQ